MAKVTLCSLLSFLLMLAGCGGGITYDTTHDSEADFKQFRTFDWLVNSEEDQHNVRDGVLLELIGAELEAKGLRRTAQPDLLVKAHREAGGVQNTMRSGYEWRDGRLNTYQLQEGTLVVDLVAAKTKRGVWRGTANGLVRAQAMPEERRALLTEVLHELFADFPPR